MTRTFVTGGTGFVGQRVVDMLVEQDHEVVAIARPTGDVRHLESLGVRVVREELYDVDILVKIMRGCEQLHHIASLVDNSWARPEDYYRSNVTATRAVFEAAAKAGIKDAVYTSSVAVMGPQPAGSIITEDTQPVYGFIHPYGHSKYLGEREAFLFVQRGMRVMAINPTLIYGPGDRNIPTSLARFIRGEDIGPIDPTGTRNTVHVDDVAKGQILAMERGSAGERYIISAETLTASRIYAIIARALGRSLPEIKARTAFQSEVSVLKAFEGSGFPDLPPNFAEFPAVDNTKSRNELGLDYMPVASSLADAVRILRTNFPKQVDEIHRVALTSA